MEYDVGAAFGRIVDILIDSMMRNLRRHLNEESDLGFDWNQWQVEQLKYLDEYRKNNPEQFGRVFRTINSRVDEALEHAYANGQKEEELRILEALANNKRIQGQAAQAAIQGAGDAFFRVNEDKLGALIDATHGDLERAEAAVLRRANDRYRKIIFDAQVYANTGAGTIEKAVDMATKDFLMSGIDCIEYKNGARHTIEDYADMCIKTAERRAYLAGEGKKRKEWGESLVVVNKRGDDPCPHCAKWCGKILIDDVYSGGEADGKHALLSEAMAQGFLHPRCRDGFVTYFPGITTMPDPVTEEEIRAGAEAEERDAREQYAGRMAKRWNRRAKYSLDPGNRRAAETRAAEWEREVANAGDDGIMSHTERKEDSDVQTIGHIDTEKYRGITDDIVTDEVIITGKQIQHVEDRHPGIYKRFGCYLQEAVGNPDYILEGNKPNTAVVLKDIQNESESVKIVLRLITSTDNPEFKNSIITIMQINKKDWDRLLRNKKIVYTRE